MAWPTKTRPCPKKSSPSYWPPDAPSGVTGLVDTEDPLPEDTDDGVKVPEEIRERGGDWVPGVYPCPECGNEDTEWATADTNLRVCSRPKGCGYAWPVPDGPVNSA